MICSSCRRTFLTRIRTLKQTPPSILSASSFRYASTVPSTPNAAPTQPPPAIAVEGANPTQSSSKPGISQPLSEPHTPSTSSATAPPGKETKGPAKVKSSVPGGQELRGLGYTKAHSRILAKEDDEYPDWLWTLLDQNKHAAGEAKVDLSAMTKKQRHRYERKMERLRQDLPVQIPVHEQSQDLTRPGVDDDPITSLQRRQEITKSARSARRRSIRESNFLKSM